MAAANWICIALLLSLCLGICSASRAGLSAMDKDAKEMASSSTREGGGGSSSTMDNGTVNDNSGPNCSDGSPPVDIVGGCDLVCSCLQRGQGAGSITELAQTVKELTRKFDAGVSGLKNDAMEPAPGHM